MALPAERDRLPSHRALGACLSLLLAAWAAAAPAQPRRIVSINVCTDQLLVALVEPARIASLSFLATDPRSSWIAAQAAPFHTNRGTAEEVIALRPDLVVTVTFGFGPAVAILERLGYSVLQVPMARTLEDIAAGVSLLAEAVGERARGEALVASLRSEIQRRRYASTSPRPLFASYEADGWITGRDSLQADVARAAGLDTVGNRLGFDSGRRVSLEQLLMLRPALLDLGHRWDESPALASQTLRHPALQLLADRTTVIDVPDASWLCGSMGTLEALAMLRAARDTLVTGP